MESSCLSVSIFLSQYHPCGSAFSIKMTVMRWKYFMYWWCKSAGLKQTEEWRDGIVAGFELVLGYDEVCLYSTVDYGWMCCLNQYNMLAFSF